MRRIESEGYFVEWESEGEGYARLVIKKAPDLASEIAEKWLPEDEWFSYEFHGEDAFELALKAALNDLWPERKPHRFP
jgi:hypothetical protein